MAIQWPYQCIPSRTPKWALMAASVSGGRSITGSEQVILSDAGYWTTSVTVSVVEEEMVLAWRAFIAQLDGRHGIAAVPAFDLFTGSDVMGRRFPFSAVAPISGYRGDDWLFDHSGMGQQIDASVVLTMSATAGATQITVNGVPAWQAPRPGMFFGIGERLYRVKSCFRATDGAPWVIRFQPRLREDVATGSAINLSSPFCSMRLAEDGAGELDLDIGYVGDVTVQFVEAF